jgi:molecular chaperone GrpE (heat shock protein)
MRPFLYRCFIALILLCWAKSFRVPAFSKLSRGRIGKNIVLQKRVFLQASTTSTEGQESVPTDQIPIADQALQNSSVSLDSNETLAARNVTAENLKAAKIKKLENKLEKDLKALEDELVRCRKALYKVNEEILVSGSRGYYLVQAEVNEFLVRLLFTSKTFFFINLFFFLYIQKNKKKKEKDFTEKYQTKFVEKMLPILDRMRALQLGLPPTTRIQRKLHEDYETILFGIEYFIKKIGFKIIDPGKR